MNRILPLARGRHHALRHVQVMGILNATPDSFSDGGRLEGRDLDLAVRTLVAEGADMLDIGGESTRPGHTPVPEPEETARVIPVIEAARRVDGAIPVSIDTRKAGVARAAIAAGADWVNDVAGLVEPAMAAVVREEGCAVVLMRTKACIGDVVTAARAQLGDLLEQAQREGIKPEQVILDPGLGFGEPPGRDASANLALLRSAGSLGWGRPVLVGASRKRFIGDLSGVAEPAQRVAGSVAAALLAAQAGAAIVRVHDVGATVQALAVAGFHPGARKSAHT